MKYLIHSGLRGISQTRCKIETEMMRKKHICIQVQKLFFERRLSNPFLQSMAAAKIRLNHKWQEAW